MVTEGTSGAGTRPGRAVTLAVNRRLGTLLADRMSELKLTTGDVLDVLAAAGEADRLFTTTDPDARRRTIGGWTRNRPAPAVVFELLAALEPVDPMLVELSEMHGRLRGDLRALPVEAGLRLATCLHQGLDDPPPQAAEAMRKGATTTTSTIWQWAAELLNAAADHEPAGAILIDAPGFESAWDEEAIDGVMARQWRWVLWRALAKGWRVRHVVSWGSPTSPLAEAAQAELVVNLLYAAHGGRGDEPSRRYEPVIGSPLPPANVIAAHGVGSLAIWRSGTARYAQRLPDGELAEFLTASEAPRGWELAAPTVALGHDAYSRLRFDVTLAAAESAPDAQHCMVKSGLPLVLMPEEVAMRQGAGWGRRRSDEKPYVQIHHETRKRRRQAFEAMVDGPPGRYRDIITVQGVKAYIATGDLGGGAFGGQHLAEADRIRHIRELAKILAGRPGYQLALVDERALLVPVAANWWAAVRGREPESRAVFVVSARQRRHAEGAGPPEEHNQGWIADSAVTNVVDAFFDLFDVMWGVLAPEAKAPDYVVGRLEALADEAERALA